SMAMYGSKLAFRQIHLFLQGKISRHEMETAYQTHWNATFQKRLQTGRWIQGLFGRGWVTDYFIRLMQPFPSIADRLIKQTHGESF
ncbi:MAG TPA: pyridine nucleotide-disulfide oxidoreductase, partial [Agriterribacter sp.]|nr:pyridine nucleotide-disulfide oxidoreductase [Agriterribacter sp.]